MSNKTLRSPPIPYSKDEFNKWAEDNLFGKRVQVKKWIEDGRRPGAYGVVTGLAWIYSEQFLLEVTYDDGESDLYSVLGHIRKDADGKSFYDSELRFLKNG